MFPIERSNLKVVDSLILLLLPFPKFFPDTTALSATIKLNTRQMFIMICFCVVLTAASEKLDSMLKGEY